MNPRICYTQLLSDFLGAPYKDKLPVEEMDMFCLLQGIGIAKNLCKLVYSTVNVPIVCENLLRYEEKQRLELYDECYNIAKGYICQVKTLGDKSYYNWYKEMQKKFETDKEGYSKKCKEHADKIMFVIYDHLMKKD